MSLIETLDKDVKEALKGGDKLRLGVLRLVKSAVHNQEIASGQPLDEAGVAKVLAKEAKQRQDSIAMYKAAAQAERAAAETAELEIIEAYLPKKLSEDELKAIVETAISSSGATGPADMGKAMGEANKLAAGRADGAQLAALVKVRLSA